jgi:hypothetical protein
MKKSERHHLKRRIIQMEAILNLCVRREIAYKNHAKGA